MLDDDPGHLTARWLFNIAHMTLGTPADELPEAYRLPQEVLGKDAVPRMTNVAAEANVDDLSLAGSVIADDFRGDGLLSLVVWLRTDEVAP